MTLGILLVSVWFFLVAAYLVWQFVTDALAAPPLAEDLPLLVPVPVEPFVLQPVASSTTTTLLPVSVAVR